MSEEVGARMEIRCACRPSLVHPQGPSGPNASLTSRSLSLYWIPAWLQG